MQRRASRWYREVGEVHRWSSLICSAFLLLICLTGLPLIFHEEIDHWLEAGQAYAVLPGSTLKTDLDHLGPIVVLGSGLYLWIARPKLEKAAKPLHAPHIAMSALESAE